MHSDLIWLDEIVWLQRALSPGLKRPGREIWPLNSFQCQGYEWVDIYLFSICVLSEHGEWQFYLVPYMN